jgi:type I restriction enzyme, R subunit
MACLSCQTWSASSVFQCTKAGEHEVKKALRKTLFKYKLHADEELFEKTYSHIRKYC